MKSISLEVYLYTSLRFRIVKSGDAKINDRNGPSTIGTAKTGRKDFIEDEMSNLILNCS